MRGVGRLVIRGEGKEKESKANETQGATNLLQPTSLALFRLKISFFGSPIQKKGFKVEEAGTGRKVQGAKITSPETF